MQKVLILAAALVIAPLAAQAAAPDYNYLDLSLSKASINDFSGGKGYQLDGSYAFANYWYVAASYGHNSFNGGLLTGGFFTTDEVLAVGGHLALTDSLDLVGRVAYASDNWKQGPSTNLFPGFTVATSDTQDGYDFGFGIRAMPLDQLELTAFIDRDNAGLMSHDHNRAETTGSVGAMYKVTDDFGLGLSYARGTQSDASNWMLSGRWYFMPNQ
ncbi:MAG: outer membrane beta-barrel protein [Gammaproteobacteria bacterium]